MNNTNKLYFVALFTSSLIIHYKQYKKNKELQEIIENLQHNNKRLQSIKEGLCVDNKIRIDFNKINDLEKKYDAFEKQCYKILQEEEQKPSIYEQYLGIADNIAKQYKMFYGDKYE